jgi:recombination protein RecT
MSSTDVAAPVGKHPREVFRTRLYERKGEIKNMLPTDISVDAFIRAAETSVQLNPEILACTWQSLWDALVRACRAGLLPDGQEAAIVPFKAKAQFLPMVQGVLRNARRSGQLKWIKADVVREGETYMHEVTHEGEIFRHVPGDDFGAQILRAYAVAITKDGAFFSAVLSLAEINKHRAFSRAGREDSPWNQWAEAMSVKTAIHKLGKMLPSVRDAIADDDTIIELPAPRIAPAATKPAPQPADAGDADGAIDNASPEGTTENVQAPEQISSPKKKPQPESANPG